MCIQVTELYSICRCLYYKHAVDPCSAKNQRGHNVVQKTAFVATTCDQHSDSSFNGRTNPATTKRYRSAYSTGSQPHLEPFLARQEITPDLVDKIDETEEPP